MAREKGYAPTKGPKTLPEWKHDTNIVPTEVKAALTGYKKVDPKNRVKVQGHKAYKKFVSWS